ncbi:GDSL-type esterase/lipase family protein [Mycolicibacter kumamotonensis]|uniref:hyaluronate lyase N-terminal domain-containing protein n=1 Tax=Mycolicibacter kumamotonensis TaxID=354243 RepID=UPI001055F593|nr:GDSL-type esterase/lipase family protein [Mycolicibacter kumamotonensis]
MEGALKLSVRIQQRRDAAGNWASRNPTLAQGEIGFVTGSTDFKVGDGTTPWNALAPWSPTKGAPKLVSIADNCWGSAPDSKAAASTAGTSKRFFNIGVGATNIQTAWHHWYTDMDGGEYDLDPSGPITFSASLEVISSTSPGTVVGQLWRLTFGGRTTPILDPGGQILSDPLGLSLAAGDVIAVRTYLSSGTAYAPELTWGNASTGVPGGFTAGSDLTAPGSAAIPDSTGYYYGPANVLGYPDDANNAKSVLALGDSIGHGGGDISWTYTIPTKMWGFLPRALSGKAGLLNLAIGGDEATLFQGTNGSFRRISVAGRTNSAIIEYGANDLGAGVSAASLEAAVLDLASKLRRLGISKVFLLTIVPRSTSTDNWATITNQTTDPSNPQRVLYNTWVRAKCPVDPETKAAVAVGTPGALLAGSFGHPITGMFDVAATVESSLNSGLWAPASRVATGSMASGDFILTTSSTTFSSANQESGGDKGLEFILSGAGASGAALRGSLAKYQSNTSYQTNTIASTTVTDAALTIGPMTEEGVHPTSRGHNLMAAAIDTALL